MSQRVYCFGLLSVLACSSGVGAAGARASAKAPVPVASPRATAPIAKSAVASAPRAYQDQADRDRLFIENAERAIGEYTAFLARAGTNEDYAQAAKRSREQIEDLRAAIDFVRAGSAQRAAQ